MTQHLSLAALAALLALAAPALAQDAAKGDSEYRKCMACHAIVADDGTEIRRGGKTGPNLYGVVGRPIASADFNYGEDLAAVGATGAVWDEASLVEYIKDPAAWLKAALDDNGARSKMTFKLARGGEDVVAYLASVATASE